MSSLGVFDKECHTFLEMLNDLRLDKRHQQYCMKRMITTAIRATIIFSAAQIENGQTRNL